MSETKESNCRCHRFEGKVALITGAASGIGRQTALRFAAEGAKVMVCDFNAEGLAGTMDLLAAQNAESASALVDVRSLEQVEACVAAAVEKWGQVDILVNNAGTGQFMPFAMMPDEEYDRVMDINVRGMFFFSRAVMQGMMDRNYGKIVNITSIMSVIAGQGQSIYNASKGAAKMLTQAMALDCTGYAININAIGPGMVHTGLTRNLLADDESTQPFLDRIPMRRIGEPDDIASAILFLSSDEASYIHGTTLFVDGGMLAGNLV